ncbi:hypothetical protein BDC45DRAFT_326119 [Circinella umbellata]|nr:hypothetical protein BDC45DRAFT_326119 [Circinella umbellata]
MWSQIYINNMNKRSAISATPSSSVTEATYKINLLLLEILILIYHYSISIIIVLFVVLYSVTSSKLKIKSSVCPDEFINFFFGFLLLFFLYMTNL